MTVFPPPPVAFEAAPNAAPAAAPLATGWAFCSSAGGGAGWAGGGWAGTCCSGGIAVGGSCDDARGTIAIRKASAIANAMNLADNFILASYYLGPSVPVGNATGETYLHYEALPFGCRCRMSQEHAKAPDVLKPTGRLLVGQVRPCEERAGVPVGA